MSDEKTPRFATRVIHGGQRPDPLTGAVMPPIYATSTYVQSSPGVTQGYEYSRTHNPTRDALQASLANLEGGAAAFAFASGMAASATLLELLDAGAHVIAMDDLYGGSYRLLENVRKRSAGYSVSFVDLTDLGALEAALRPDTRLIWVETPTNPLLKIVDLGAVAGLARGRGILTVCDNTFATPYAQRPLEHGFDVVMHSTTKFLNGHSDSIGGAAVLREDAALAERLAYLQNALGAVPGPFDSFLTLRGIKTLALRFERQCSNAKALAEWLGAHPCVDRVYHCSDPNHPDACAIQHLFTPGLFGAILSFEIKGADKAAVMAFMDRLRMIVPGTSLGDVHTLLLYPTISSHRELSPKMRERMGIRENLVRVAAGIEALDDIKGDLDAALRSS